MGGGAVTKKAKEGLKWKCPFLVFGQKGSTKSLPPRLVNEAGLSKLDFDAVEEVSIENGAEDVEFTDPIVLVACDVPSLIGLVDESWCRG